jgi:hypothetical protein
MENYMKYQAIFKRSGKFDIYDFKTIVPESCLKHELQDLFVYRVKNQMKMMDNKKNLNIVDPYNLNKYIFEYQGTDDSVFFDHGIPPKKSKTKENESSDDDEFYDEEIRF